MPYPFHANATCKTAAQTFGLGSTSDRIGRQGNGGVYSVARLTLDSLIERSFRNLPIDLCKIDIEGTESDVFFGNHCSRINQVKRLIMEIHHRHTYDDLIARLGQLGFSVKHKPTGGLGVHLLER